jgi:hypothetical protein
MLARYRAIDRMSPLLGRQSSKNPGSPAGVFSLMGAYPLATGEAGADQRKRSPQQNPCVESAKFCYSEGEPENQSKSWQPVGYEIPE